MGSHSKQRVGIIGAGYAGLQLHAPAIRGAGGSVAWFVDPYVRAGGKALDYVPVYRSLSSALEAESPGLVTLAAPPGVVSEYVLELESHCQTMVFEKPLMLQDWPESFLTKLDEAELHCGFVDNWPYIPVYRRLQELLRGRALEGGDARLTIIRPTTGVGAAPGWRQDLPQGGAGLWDWGWHLVSLVIHFIGMETPLEIVESFTPGSGAFKGRLRSNNWQFEIYCDLRSERRENELHFRCSDGPWDTVVAEDTRLVATPRVGGARIHEDFTGTFREREEAFHLYRTGLSLQYCQWLSDHYSEQGAQEAWLRGRRVFGIVRELSEVCTN